MVPALPGGVGITHVKVYDTESPDGLAGGTPHLHTVCSEAYLVISGRGEVHTLGAGGFERTPLVAGTVAWFSPGTIHRLVNHGGLEVYVVMSHAGLPEAGDLVIAFDEATLADPTAYESAAGLPPAGERRDRAVEAFAGWRRRFETDASDAMASLHGHAGAVVSARADAWSDVVRRSTGQELDRSLEWIDNLRSGGVGHLAGAAVAHQAELAESRGAGCCGTLGAVITS